MCYGSTKETKRSSNFRFCPCTNTTIVSSENKKLNNKKLQSTNHSHKLRQVQPYNNERTKGVHSKELFLFLKFSKDFTIARFQLPILQVKLVDHNAH